MGLVVLVLSKSLSSLMGHLLFRFLDGALSLLVQFVDLGFSFILWFQVLGFPLHFQSLILQSSQFLGQLFIWMMFQALVYV
jgi:hypothetical protein